MLPKDIEHLIMEFHDGFDIARKKFEIHLVLKSAFAEFERNENLFYHLDGCQRPKVRILYWFRLMFNLQTFDKRMMKVRKHKTCYSQLWNGFGVPWDGS